jgi:enamine deaminase RidA (YjgF/YER057c/UK114 family)
MSAPEQRLVELGIELPAPPRAVGAYLPTQVVGDMLYTSGVLPVLDGKLAYLGIVGAGLSIAEGVAAARLCALNLLALIRAETGSLDRVERIVQISGFVRSGEDFRQQPKVLNGASDLLIEILGERGRHTRMALGTSELPLGAAVEISAVVKLAGRPAAVAAAAR